MYAWSMAAGNGHHLKVNDLSATKDIFGPGDIVDRRYRVERRIAAGGMGTVYRVTHLQTNCPMALKVLHPDRALDRDARRLFEQELQMSSIIRPNPHIVHVYDAGLDAQRGVRYLVMNFLDGMTIEEYILEWGPVPPEVVMTLASQCARAMKQVHQAGVVHRDLKPSNIFITITDEGKPHAMISDFGIAKVAQGPTFGFVTPVCTPAYAPPELLLANVPITDQLGGKSAPLSITPATDVYSFGLILYEMLTGARPGSLLLDHTETTRPRTTTSIRTEPIGCTIAQACARSPQLPDGSADWLKKCLQFNPADRWQSIEESVNELAKLFAADGRFSDMDTSIKYVIVPKLATPQRSKRNARTQVLADAQNMVATDKDVDASESKCANAQPKRRWVVPGKKPLLMTFTAAIVAIWVVLTSRFTEKEASNTPSNPTQAVFAAHNKETHATIRSSPTTVEPTARLHFRSNAGCMILIDGKPGGNAPLTNISIDTNKPHAISIKCEPDLFGFCTLTMRPGEFRTIQIDHPEVQFDPTHRIEDDCSRWYD